MRKESTGALFIAEKKEICSGSNISLNMLVRRSPMVSINMLQLCTGL